MRPNVCDILGVGLEEEFEFVGNRFRIEEICDESDDCIGYDLMKYDDFYKGWQCADTLDLVGMLNHLDWIVCNRWKNEDIADAKKIKSLFKDAYYIKQSDSGDIIFVRDDDFNTLCTIYPRNCVNSIFQSLGPSENVKIDSIIMDADGGDLNV